MTALRRRTALQLSLCLLLALGAASCRPRPRAADVQRVLDLELPSLGREEVTEERIAEIEADVARLRNRLEDRLELAGDLRTALRLLATTYEESGFLGLAWEAYQEALDLEPENPILFYRSAVVAGRYAQAQVEEAERDSLLRASERLYSRALQLDPEYEEAAYGLAVLYSFELEQPAAALEAVQTALSVDPRDERSRLLLGRILAQLGRLSDAADIYGELARTATSESLRSAALENERQLREVLR